MSEETKARTADILRKWSGTFDTRGALPVMCIGMIVEGEDQGVPVVASSITDRGTIIKMLRSLLATFEEGNVIHRKIPN